MKRKSLSKSSPNRNFKKGMRVHKKNITPKPQRGGIRA